jgi:apolipoprotein N-acyltransferase
MTNASPPLERSIPADTTAATLTSRVPSWVVLVVAGAIALLTGPRWAIAALAWIAPVPYLVYARRIRTWRGWVGLAGFMLVIGCVQISTIATPPVPLLGILGFGPPPALILFASTLVAELTRRRIGEATAVFAFAATTTVLAWVGYGVTELGAWMSPSITQVDHLGFLQLAAIGGLGLLDFVMAAAGASIAMLVAAPRGKRRSGPVIAIGAVLLVSQAWSALRLTEPLPGRSVTVGAVVTDVGLDEGGMPGPERLAANTEALFARTRLAAERGARLVVWNEVATVIEPADEPAFVARAQALARELQIDLVLAYAGWARKEPLLLDNKYLFISDAGEILDTYQKHHPVPGEPSIRGTGPMTVLDRPYARVGGAICYDYDFPAIAREHAARGAELVVLPSSDWRGIDPVHTKMARVRAIEGGFSIVRAARWAASGAFDAYGRIHAWMPTTQQDFVMMATVPVGRQHTLAGDLAGIVVGLAAVYLGGVLAWLMLRRKRTTVIASVLASGLLAGCAADFSPLVPATVDDDLALPALDINGTRLHLETFGTPGRPVVIGLHGGPGHDYRGLLPLAQLADDYFVVLWDQRGTGLSRRHACDDVSAAAYLADLEAIVDRFAPSGGPPLYLVGHSWGAMYATWFINEHPERVAAAVMVEPGGFTKQDVADYFTALTTAAPLSEAIGDGLWTGRLLTPDDHARADLMMTTMYEASAEPLGMSASDPLPSWRSGGVVSSCMPPSAGDFDWTTQLDRFTGRVLYLHGDRNRVSPASRQRELASSFVNVEIEQLFGAGHDLHWVLRDQFIPLVRAHLGAQGGPS